MTYVPEWIWVLLAIPTVASALFIAWVGGLYAVRECQWRRHRHPPTLPVILQPGSPSALAKDSGDRSWVIGQSVHRAVGRSNLNGGERAGDAPPTSSERWRSKRRRKG